MKTILRYSFVLAMTAIVLTTSAHELPLVEKTKTYSKTYSLANGEKVRLENKFGELEISTWNKNEISVQVVMTAKGNTDDRATYILGRLRVEDGKNSDGVWFRTDISNGDKKNKNNTYKDEGFSINYKVQMPAGAILDASNEFGSTTLGDYEGSLRLSSKFGDLKTGKISNVKKVSVEFGTAHIKSISNGELVIKFSRALIDHMDGTVKANFEHCSGVKLNIDNNLKDLQLRNEFTNLFLDLSKNLAANFNIYTNFGELKNRSDFELLTEKENEDHGPNFDKTWLGKSGKGTTGLRIKANFSNVTLGHGLNMDLKESKKSDGRKTTSI